LTNTQAQTRRFLVRGLSLGTRVGDGGDSGAEPTNGKRLSAHGRLGTGAMVSGLSSGVESREMVEFGRG